VELKHKTEVFTLPPKRTEVFNMRLFAVSAIVSAALSAVSAFPQGSVSVEDLAKGALNAKYGQDSGDIDQNVLSEIFGAPAATPASVTPPPGSGDPAGYVDGDDIELDVADTSCESYQDYGFHCVEYYQCNNGLIIKDGSNLFDIRTNLGSAILNPTQSKCKGALEVCCRDSDWEGLPLPTLRPPVTQPPVTQPPVTQAPITEPPYVPPVSVTSGPVDPVTNVNPVDPVTNGPVTEPPYTPTPVTPAPVPLRQCGRRNTGGIGVRIQNNNNDYFGTTQFGEWPHMCAILKKGEVSGKEVNFYVGGASLIHPGIVLTAAHIVDDFVESPETLKIRCGEWDTRQVVEPLKHEDRTAATVSVHPAYNSRNLQNDFALVHLEYEFILDNHINTICLPNEYTPFNTTGCFATGWGKDKFGKSGNYQEILKQVPLDLVDHDTCEANLRTTRLGKFYELDNSFLCAGGVSNQDTCKGDGGGPLVCPIDDYTPFPTHFVQTGIVAWGIGCGDETPGVYANVPEAMCFIDWSTKCVHGQDKDYYEMKGCQDWAKRQYCAAKNAANYAETPVEIKKAAHLESLYEQAVKGCAYGPDYQKPVIDCSSDDSDVSNFARDSNLDVRDSNFPSTTAEPTEFDTNPRIGLTTASSGGVNFGKR